MWAGPNISVPNQIKAQCEFDNVFWYNMNNIKNSEWLEMGVVCHNVCDFPKKSLSSLPQPFNNPDLVVFEEFYTFSFEKIVKEIQKRSIPYIIIPRSTMTHKAQLHKPLKKKIGNLLFFKKMSRRASAIHFLTEQEYLDSGNSWNDCSFIIPNGIYPKENVRLKRLTDTIHAVYIGRIEIYQKGLDLLIEAIHDLKDTLIENRFSLSIYGPDREGGVSALQELITKYELKDVVHIYGAVFKEEKEKILRDSDLFIMTSRFEGLSMGLLEALSFGVPALVSTGTNMTSKIIEYKAGFDAGNDVSSIKTALLEFIKSKKNITELSENAIALSNNYSWHNIAIVSHEKYSTLVKENEK